MQFSAADKVGSGGGTGGVDELVRHIGRLLRHPAYRRNQVVSALLLRHLPTDGGYAWRGETALRARLAGARLDAATLDHLLASARSEFARLRKPADA